MIYQQYYFANESTQTIYLKRKPLKMWIKLGKFWNISILEVQSKL